MSNSLLYDSAWIGDAPIGRPWAPVEDGSYKGQWPRMCVLSKDTKERLSMWIDDEIEAFNAERASLLEDWKSWQTLYWAAPATTEKNFPFKRAANVVIPLAAIAVEAVHARIMNTLFSVEPFWSIRPRSKEWIDLAKPMEEYLQSEVENGETLKMFEFCTEFSLELCKLGTAVAKSGYEKEIRKSLRKYGDVEEEFYVTTRNGASIGRVPLANFVMRFSELDPQKASLVGEKHKVSWGQLKRYAQTERMSAKTVEAIKQYWLVNNVSAEPNDGDAVTQKTQQLAKTEPTWAQTFDFYELWLSFDIDGDGWDEEIVVDYHKETREFLSIRYNWYDDLHRPYRVCNYLGVEGIWPGIGICKQVEQFQEEATTIHRQRLDNATLANMTQLAIKKNIGYGPGEPIFPGKIWFLDDPIKDIREFKLSEVYPSSYNNENVIVDYYEKRSGANEVILGIPQEGTPGTATSDLTRLAEGNKRFDLVLKNIKRCFSLIGQDVVANYQIFGNQQAHWLVLGDDGVYVEQVLMMPSTLVRKGAIIDLTVTDSITNRDVEQRTWLQLFQVITNYYDRVLQLAQVLAQGTGDIQMFMGIAQRALMASDEAMRRMLETFQIPDADRFSLAGDANEQNAGGSPTGAIGGGAGGTGPAFLNAGMASPVQTV